MVLFNLYNISVPEGIQRRYTQSNSSLEASCRRVVGTVGSWNRETALVPKTVVTTTNLTQNSHKKRLDTVLHGQKISEWITVTANMPNASLSLGVPE